MTNRAGSTVISSRPLWFFSINIILIVISRILTVRVLGFSTIGYLWVIMLLYCLMTIIINRRISFPILFYLPFMLYVLIYITVDFSFVGLQSTLQYLVPVLAGMAFSGLKINEQTIQRIFYYNRILIVFICLYALIYPYTAGFNTIALGLPDIVMTCSFCGTLLLGEFFVLKKRTAILLFILIAFVPVFAVTRMGVVANLIILPLNFYHEKFRSRILWLTVIIALGYLIFNLQNFQNKMFFSGHGKISDISLKNEDLSTSGRRTLTALLERGITEKPIWGNGPRSELELFERAGLTIKETHNDYLAVRYSYGWVGLFLLLGAYMFQMISLFARLRKTSNVYQRVMIQAALTLFIPFLLFMYTDNILKYTFFFGTLHFIIISIAYQKVSTTDSPKHGMQKRGNIPDTHPSGYF